MNMLIITPLQSELDFLLHGCTARGVRVERATAGRLPVVRMPDLGITLARGGTGKAQFALQTQHLLDTGAAWDLAVCAGAAGALADEVAVGDVVVATTTVEHDYNNKFVSRPRPSFEGAPAAVDSLRRAAPALQAFKVYFGTVASGDEDVVDAERRQSLRLETGALAVAWEGAGGARACHFCGVPFVEIRGITDAADHGAPASFEANLALAMDHIAALILAWLEQL